MTALDFNKTEELRKSVDLVKIDKEARLISDDLVNDLKTETKKLEDAKLSVDTIDKFFSDVDALTTTHMRLTMNSLNQFHILTKSYYNPDVDDGFDVDIFNLADRLMQDVQPKLYAHFLVAYIAQKLGFHKTREFWRKQVTDNTNLTIELEDLREEVKELREDNKELKADLETETKRADDAENRNISMEREHSQSMINRLEGQVSDLKSLLLKKEQETEKKGSKKKTGSKSREKRLEEACKILKIDKENVLDLKIDDEMRDRLKEYLKFNHKQWDDMINALRKKYKKISKPSSKINK